MFLRIIEDYLKSLSPSQLIYRLANNFANYALNNQVAELEKQLADKNSVVS